MNAFLSICKIISYLFPVSGSSATSVQTHILSPSSNAALFSPLIFFHFIPTGKSIHLDARTLRDLCPVPERVGAVFGAAASLEIGRR